MSKQPSRNDTVKVRLSAGSREIKITVTGRSLPAPSRSPYGSFWRTIRCTFSPVQGSDTQWYQNVLQKPAIGIGAGDAETEVQVTPGDRRQTGVIGGREVSP